MTGGEPVEVRLAGPEHLAEAARVTLAAYEPFVTGPGDGYLEELADTARRALEAELYVAVDGERVLGCVTSCPPGSPWREQSGPGEGEFRMLAVDPVARGRGVGAALVAVCERRAREVGARGMVLSSLPRMTDAHRLYRRLGYRRDPERDWTPVPGVDLIAFTRRFDAAEAGG